MNLRAFLQLKGQEQATPRSDDAVTEVIELDQLWEGSSRFDSLSSIGRGWSCQMAGLSLSKSAVCTRGYLEGHSLKQVK